MVGRVKEGSEVDLGAAPFIPCRVAFERGKERAVFLSVARSHHGDDPTASLVRACAY